MVDDRDSPDILVDQDFLRVAMAQATQYLECPDERGLLAANVNYLVRLLRQSDNCRIKLVRLH